MSELYTNSVYFRDFNNRKNIVLTRSAYYLSHKLLKLVSVLQLECKGTIKSENARSLFVWRGLTYIKKWHKYMSIFSYHTVTY